MSPDQKTPFTPSPESVFFVDLLSYTSNIITYDPILNNQLLDYGYSCNDNDDAGSDEISDSNVS